MAYNYQCPIPVLLMPDPHFIKNQYNKFKGLFMIQSLSVPTSIDEQSSIRSMSPQLKHRRPHPLSLKPLHHKPRSQNFLDNRSQKYSKRQALPHLSKNKKKYSNINERDKIKQKSKSIHNHNHLIHETRRVMKKGSNRRKLTSNHETYVERHQEEKQAMTVLSIRFASEDGEQKVTNRQQAYIKAIHQEQNITDIKEENKLPYLQYKKSINPQQQLRQMGYSSDTRLASQVYSDKVEQKKVKYVNKMQALKKKLDSYQGNHQQQNNSMDIRRDRIQKSRIQVKILGEQIRRNRQRQLIRVQERKGRKMLEQLLKDNS